MNDMNEKAEKLERALLQAGRSVTPLPPRGAWHADVMRSVRRIGPLATTEASDSVLWGLIWKVALPAAACAVALCVAVQASGISEGDVTQDVEMNSTVEYALASVF